MSSGAIPTGGGYVPLGPIEGPRLPDDDAGSSASAGQSGAGAAGGPTVSRQPTSTRLPDPASDALRDRLLGGRIEGPAPESFADRMDRLTAERRRFTMEDLPGASRESWRGEMNRSLVRLANEDPDVADEAEKAIGKGIEKELTRLVEGSTGEKPTPAQITAMSKALASEIRRLEVGGVSIDALGDGVDLLVGDLGAALARGLAFKKTEREVRAEAREAGGLFPGEDVEVNDRVGKPLAEAAAEAKGAVEERLKTDFYFKTGVKIDAKKIFSALDEVVGEVKVDTGFEFRQGDFRAKVGAEIEVDDPLSREGATARVRGYAEVRNGGFSAGVEGRAVVESLYTDPTLGPRADVSMYLRYADPRITASLEGRASLPTRPGAGYDWGANASLGYKLSDNATLSAGVGVSGGSGRRPETTATVGLTIRF